MPSLEELTAFLAVLESESFTQAARRLGVTTNAVSLRIQRLEQALGHRLFHRSTRLVRPTEEARRYGARISSVLSALEDAEEELLSDASRVRGCVRIGLPGVLATGPLLEALGALLREHNELQVELRVSGKELDLGREGLDIAVVVAPSATSAQVGRRLGRVEWVLAAAPHYLRRRGRPERPAELRDHECLRYAEHPAQDEWTLVDAKGRATVVPVRGAFEADDSRVLGDATYAGLGIGIRPAREVVEAQRAGQLRRVLPGYRFAGLDVFAVLAKGRSRIPRVARCLSVLERAVVALS